MKNMTYVKTIKLISKIYKTCSCCKATIVPNEYYYKESFIISRRHIDYDLCKTCCVFISKYCNRCPHDCDRTMENIQKCMKEGVVF